MADLITKDELLRGAAVSHIEDVCVESSLLPYQRRFLEDPSPRKMLIHARRIGGSYVGTLDAGKRDGAVVGLGDGPWVAVWDDGKRRVSSAVTRCPPDPLIITALLRRESPRHITVDGLHLVGDQRGVWKAVLALNPQSISLIGGGCRPDELLATLRWSPGWSVHVVTIYDAVRDGYPSCNVEEIRKQLSDEDWRREYLCEVVG